MSAMDPPSATTGVQTSAADTSDAAPASSDKTASQTSEDSQTAADFINDQLRLEADAREALPYAFDSCTQPLGPLRQILFACLTCNPPPKTPSEPFIPAGVCYSCSIACHGEHTLVELFNKRDFVCDCGTTRLPSSSPCTLRINAKTERKGNVHSETPAPGNKYNHNFQNRFCGCETEYDADKEKGTMYQCLGLGSEEDGGCGEDWWHPACLVGLKPDWHTKASKAKVEEGIKSDNKEGEPKPIVVASSGADGNDAAAAAEAEDTEADQDEPNPPGFPAEDDFETFLCYKCVEAHPWVKRYAGTTGFLPPIFRDQPTLRSGHEGQNGATIPTDELPTEESFSKKRKADDSPEQSPIKKPKSDVDESSVSVPADDASGNAPPTSDVPAAKPCRYNSLPPPPTGTLSVFLKEDFREHLCRCPTHFPLLAPHPQLLEEEDPYEPPLSVSSEGGAPGSSVGTGSLLDRGQRALSNVDRVRAIEGVMVYNHLKEKVKSFLQPFAEEGRTVGAEDIKTYFEKLRGDAEGVREAGAAARKNGDGDSGEGGGRKEQSGY